MATYCPKCGAENTEVAFSCVSCGWPLRPATDSVAVLGDGQRPGGQGAVAPPLPGKAKVWRSSATMMLISEVLALLAAVLLLTSFLLFVYYYESWIGPNRDFDDLARLQDVVKAMEYSSVFGELFALLALVLVVGGVMLTGAAPVAEYLGRAKLSGVQVLLVAMAALMCMAAVTTVVVYEWGSSSEDLMRFLLRIVLYVPSLVAPLLVFLLASVTDGLRRGVLDTRPGMQRPQSAETPRTRNP